MLIYFIVNLEDFDTVLYDDWRMENDLDAIVTGTLFADTLFSTWLPIRCVCNVLKLQNISLTYQAAKNRHIKQKNIYMILLKS